MNTIQRLHFLADRAEDGKVFILQGVEFVFIKNEIYDNEQGFPINLKISQLLNGELELKPEWYFTEDEKAILRNLPSEYKWIARDNNSKSLYIHHSKPIKKEKAEHWESYYNDNSRNIGRSLTVYNHLFQSIQWEDAEPCEFKRYI